MSPLTFVIQHLLKGVQDFEDSIRQTSSIEDNYILRRLLQDHSDAKIATSTDTLAIIAQQELKYISRSKGSFKVSGLLVLYRLIDLCRLLLDHPVHEKAIHPKDPGLIAELIIKSKACIPGHS